MHVLEICYTQNKSSVGIAIVYIVPLHIHTKEKRLSVQRDIHFDYHHINYRI